MTSPMTSRMTSHIASPMTICPSTLRATRSKKTLALMAMILLASPNTSHALTPGKTLELAPHRAVYEMRLGDADQKSGIVSVKGRMVFEFQGNACEGYTQNMRFVTEIMDRRGKTTLTDLRSSSWEDGLGKRFRFNSQHYRNQNLQETIKGDAKRDDTKRDVDVALSKPKKQKLRLSDKVMFPNQHSVQLLKYALSGKKVFQARIYDGSEQGKKVYDTTSIIGNENTSDKEKLPLGIPNLKRLDGVQSWPVAISYFEDGKAVGEGLPVYELGFRFYANGVSRNLLINYGDFSIRGALKEIEFFKADTCEQTTKQ